MLSDEVVRQLGDGDGLNYQFDFSKIAAEFYEPLLRTLQHFAQKKVESIGFSCDSLAKSEQKLATGQTLPVIVLNSIAKNKSHYISNIIELLCHVLPRSTRIKEITLSNMNIRKEYLSRLFSSLSKSKSLEKINFTKIPIGDELLRIMLSNIDPNQIKSIKINFCGISQKSTENIISFIHKRQIPSVGIHTFQISKIEIPEDDQILIQNALNDTSNVISPSQMSRHSPNMISPKQSPIGKPDLNINLHNVKNYNQPIGSATSNKMAQSSTRSARSAQRELRMKSELTQIKAYEQENAQLRKELADLRKSLDAVQYNESVFIVGKGAEEFVRFISEIEAKIKHLEAQKKANGGFF
ncbi:hypothetical protein TRFO_09396 [Tritrichomonas foetus]|uniref:Uncharacterized protein n=1 Tax=Tritrichomonas foetus TaxID=1144522 RepID=A0A1J4JE35_9EUKA|nr:hypothetical protein TRFO_09396 [Tritrichomonas foetus]|eukprot:OHS97418.1 hypothetical protein TRFO_09396 [Tritrichomonas foetus]